MPNSPSSTLNSPDFLGRVVASKVIAKDHEWLLLNLLAVAHRDGGQYTELAGLATSVVDALRIVDALHKDNAALKARLDRLTRG